MFRAARFPAAPLLRAPRTRAVVVPTAMVLAVILAGCVGGGSSLPSATASRSVTAGSPASGLATPIPTTQTSWGPILDALPPMFPRYPGSALANGATSGAVTSALSTDASVATVATWYGGALQAAGYRRTSLSAPAEDGSVVGEYDGSSIQAGCHARMTFRPQGSLTIVLALVAPACAEGGG